MFIYQRDMTVVTILMHTFRCLNSENTHIAVSQITGVMFFVTFLPPFLLFHYPSTLTWPFQQASLAGPTDEKAHSFHTVTVILEILS